MTARCRSVGTASVGRWLGATLSLVAVLMLPGRAAVSTDSGVPADRFVAVLADSPPGWWAGGWVRLRDMSGLPATAPADDLRYRALARLRSAGVKPLVYLAPSTAVWLHGLRETGGKKSLPLDLGEAFTLAERLAFNAWPNVAAWEIGNEPDLFWTNDNAATYAAYLKAVALGLRAGARAAREAAAQAEPGDRRGPPPRNEPLVLNGALAMTPGPFLAQLAANDALSYLDGFNWHFYGYAEEFSAQARQFETALTELAAARAQGARRSETRALPVFLTEYGYGLLGGEAARTTEGRVRQWQWFRSVGEQARALGVTGPVAFYLPPYLEHGQRELGLTMAPAARASEVARPDGWLAGGVPFAPADFGAKREEPWMRGIGARVDGSEASPALAWLAAQSAPRERAWRIRVAAPSPVVIDFVPDVTIETLKSWHGWLLRTGAGRERTGGGQLRIYNFSDRAVTGRLTARGDTGLETALADGEGGAGITLAPFALAKVPVRLRMTADALRAFAWEAVFTPDDRRVSQAAWAGRFFPNAGGESAMVKETVFRFDHAAESAAQNRRSLLARPLAVEEPRLHTEGRWLVSDGLAVEETTDGWRFTVSKLPTEPLRPAMAELPLPDGWVFSDTHLLMFEHRLASAPAGMAVPRFDCLFRTVNGNLFEVMPPPNAGATWQSFAQAKENFTGMSYGRMNLPWRFAENRPAALVFFFRPEKLPATFEVRGAAIVRFVAWPEGGAR